MAYERLGIRIKRQDDTYRVGMRLGPDTGPPKEALVTAAVPKWIPSNPLKYGKELFDWLLSARQDDGSLISDEWNQWKGSSPSRRIVLEIDEEDEALRSAKWECMQDGDTTLAAVSNTPFSRWVGDDNSRTPPRALSPDKPLRILLVVPNPANQATRYPNLVRLVPEEEERSLREALDQTIELKLLDSPCTAKEIARELMEGWHIVHFVGHGSTDDEHPGLLIEDEHSKAHWIEAPTLVKAISDELGPAADDDDRRVRLIFLASCDTATTDDDTPRSLAFQLMTAGMPAVIAMQDKADLTATREFAKEFYSSLLKHGRVDLAANQARRITFLEADDDDPTPFIPVLYNRLEGGVLLEMEQTEEPVEPPVEPPSDPPPIVEPPSQLQRFLAWAGDHIVGGILVGLVLIVLTPILTPIVIGWLKPPDPPTTPTVDVISPPATPTPFGRASVLARVRQGPDTGYYCLGEVRAGSEYPIIGEVRDERGDADWWQIRWNDQDVWIGSSVFEGVQSAGVPTAVPPELSPTVVPADELFGLIEINDGTNDMRSEPSTQAAVIRRVPQQELVEVVAQNFDGAWLQVTWCGHKGWISAGLVRMPPGFIPPVDLNTIPAAPSITPTPTTTPTATATPTMTAIPTESPTVIMTMTPEPEALEAGERREITVGTSLTIPVRYVPATQYTVDWVRIFSAQYLGFDVAIGPYWIDEQEVSNAHFAAFLEDRAKEEGFSLTTYLTWGSKLSLSANGEDNPLTIANSCERAPNTAPNGSCENHPVVSVRFDAANEYCMWVAQEATAEAGLAWDVQGRLPTEAEWELAAVGVPGDTWKRNESGQTELRYPWGAPVPLSEEVTTRHKTVCTIANLDDRTDDGDRSLWGWYLVDNDNIPELCDGYKYTAPVSDESGKSKIGALHMVGNVAEWTVTEEGLASLRGYSYTYGSGHPYPQRLFQGEINPDPQTGFRCAYPVIQP